MDRAASRQFRVTEINDAVRDPLLDRTDKAGFLEPGLGDLTDNHRLGPRPCSFTSSCHPTIDVTGFPERIFPFVFVAVSRSNVSTLEHLIGHAETHRSGSG